jgi:glycosyltransferase involved in cell wall biosynthesis
MRISIVIPTLNEAHNLGPLLQDLAGFRDQGHEVLLVDGGSDDRTVAQADGRVDRVLFWTRGRAAQMNAGARVAKGDILWFLHADSRVPADAASSLIDACGAGHHWGRFDVASPARTGFCAWSKTR